MYNNDKRQSYPYCASHSIYDPDNMYNAYYQYPCPYWMNSPYYWEQFANPYTSYTEKVKDYGFVEWKDYGPDPFVVDINEATMENDNYRTTLWTGDHLQLTLMSIDVGEDIGLEVHPNLDQFIRIEDGQGLVKMGDSKDQLDFQRRVYDDFAFIIPAGKWHNLINVGNKPLKLYSIYAPPQHPHGTIHKTKADAIEENHGY